MDKSVFMAEIKKTYEDGLKIIEAKNHDYAAGEDPFKNFRMSGFVGVSPARGILVRVCDKLARINNLLDEEAKVADEKIEDTLTDAINYLAILKALIKDENSSKS